MGSMVGCRGRKIRGHSHLLGRKKMAILPHSALRAVTIRRKAAKKEIPVWAAMALQGGEKPVDDISVQEKERKCEWCREKEKKGGRRDGDGDSYEDDEVKSGREREKKGKMGKPQIYFPRDLEVLSSSFLLLCNCGGAARQWVFFWSCCADFPCLLSYPENTVRSTIS